MGSALSVLGERHVRHLWLRQEFLRTPLRTTDGQHVEVLHPGTLNPLSGPDFLDARIRVGGILFAGDVEFHRHGSDWYGHHHDVDPHYNSVILHVVLESGRADAPVGTASGRSVPTLVLDAFLSAERPHIDHQVQLDERARTAQTIPCADINFDVPPLVMQDWIGTLAAERLTLKARRMADRYASLSSRAREQVLYEGLMDGLGYSQNRRPFMRLSTALMLDVVEGLGIVDTPLLIDALVFGVAGLLPSPDAMRDEHARTYAGRLRHAWEALRHRYRGEVLSLADWTCSPNRPSNAPTRRLAQASALIYALLRHDLALNILLALAANIDGREIHRRIALLLSISPAAYWQARRDFEDRDDSSIGIIGHDRVDVLMMNTVVPFGWMCSQMPGYEVCGAGALALWRSIPASSGNHVTRMMNDHLVRGKCSLTHAHEEQGLLQLHHFYCRRERCSACEIGKQLGLGSRPTA